MTDQLIDEWTSAPEGEAGPFGDLDEEDSVLQSISAAREALWGDRLRLVNHTCDDRCRLHHPTKETNTMTFTNDQLVDLGIDPDAEDAQEAAERDYALMGVNQTGIEFLQGLATVESLVEHMPDPDSYVGWDLAEANGFTLDGFTMVADLNLEDEELEALGLDCFKQFDGEPREHYVTMLPFDTEEWTSGLTVAYVGGSVPTVIYWTAGDDVLRVPQAIRAFTTAIDARAFVNQFRNRNVAEPRISTQLSLAEKLRAALHVTPWSAEPNDEG